MLTEKPIPYGRQDITKKDIDEVVCVLQSDWLTQGPTISAFEEKVAEYCTATFAVATCNATAALHLACLTLQVGPGDIVWTSPLTFVASSNCALYCGAGIDFVDVNPNDLNIDVEKLTEKLVLAKKQGKLPKTIICVHFGGLSCNLKAIHELSKTYGFSIIEDASHAIGGSYENNKIGSCSYSDLTVFSFHPVKIITTAEGGMVTTNNAKYYERLQSLRSHGITRSASLFQYPSHGPWYYEQQELGFNFRMTDLQAALGISQLHRLDSYVSRRHEIAKRYITELSDLPVSFQHQNAQSVSAYHLFVIRFDLQKIGKSQLEIYENLKLLGISPQVHYIPVHTQPYYQRLGFKWGDFPQAERYYRQSLSMPMFSALTHAEQTHVVASIRSTVTL